APRHALQRPGVAHALKERLAEHLLEVGFAQAQELALDRHAHRGIAARVRRERLLAEGVAALQLCQRDFDAADRALDLAAAGLDDVVEIALLALADDGVAALCGDPLEAGEKL